MAHTTLSAVGGVIQGNWLDEEIVVAVADGTQKAGDMVGMLATGVIREVDATSDHDEEMGILLPQFGTDMDSIPASGTIVNVVIPQSGHLYGVHCEDLGTMVAGNPLVLGEAGSNGVLMLGDGNIEEEHVCRVFKGMDNSTYCIVIWGV
jgi:hypothetical protein